ncbi:MAG: PH domain-containing protein [Mycobacteriaceae bacterium]
MAGHRGWAGTGCDPERGHCRHCALYRTGFLPPPRRWPLRPLLHRPRPCAPRLLFLRGSFCPYIEADVGGLTVRNPLGTRQIGWSEIRHVSPGYSGLVIRLENERSVTAWAVQEANVAAWLRRPTRSKRIAK